MAGESARLTELWLSDVFDRRVGPLTLRLGVGLTSILSDDAESLGALAELLVGLRAPKRGTVLLDNLALSGSAPARARVASVLREEALLPAPTVSAALSQALALRGAAGSAEACLAALGLERFLPVAPSALEPMELRAIAFALAAALAERSALLVLHEPFALVPLVPARVIVETCRRHARERIVVSLLSELDRGLELGERCLVLERGKPSPFGALAAGPTTTLSVRSPQAARLAELSQQFAEVSYVEVLGDEVSITTSDPVAFSRNLVSAAVEADLDITGVALPSASLHDQLWLRSLGSAR
ncbi:MAG TPA: hypothetical protein VFQ35_21255 [Polyangiaceae bacterium]|nr:hypothetical protein [Polyangiaceae bacterium]